MFKVNVNNKEMVYEHKITLEAIAESLNIKAYCAKVDNRLRELTYYLNRDSKVEFLDLKDIEGVSIYQTTLRYLLVYAIKRIVPKGVVKFSQNISRSFLCTVNGVRENQAFLDKLTEEMDKIIKENYPIIRTKVSKTEAEKIFAGEGFYDKIEILKYREENTVHTYKCNDYYNYMYGYMLPSTGYIDKFKLTLHKPGFLLQYPRSEENGAIPDFEDSPSLSSVINDAYKWSKTCRIENLASMNSFTNTREYVDFVNMCETAHNNRLAYLGDLIKKNIKNIKLIAIAGPSSSGKTTFSNRLRVELMSRGIFPLLISIDNYYKGHDETPIDENGKLDYEHIEAIDLDYFNQQLTELTEGKTVILPEYDFKDGERKQGASVKLGKNQPIIIEGIHALNERLTSSMAREEKYKIYITPYPQINIDNHNPIRVTDIRLLRRIVRDAQFRKTTPEETFKMWPSVRRGEFKWIYPFQEEADFIFNTELTYEIMVMKKYAMPVLQSIADDSEYFITANRLIKFLKYVKVIDEKYVPCNSILREFIGGSCFYDR